MTYDSSAVGFVVSIFHRLAEWKFTGWGDGGGGRRMPDDAGVGLDRSRN